MFPRQYTVVHVCRVQGGVQPVRQGRGRDDHHQGAGHRDALPGTEPHRGRAPGHDQRGRRRRYVDGAVSPGY